MREKITILPGEKWITISSLENINSNHYIVSSLGRMGYYRSIPEDGYIMSLKDYGSGYLQASIRPKNRTSPKTFSLHVLVAETFLYKAAGKDYVIHKDGNLKNNLLTNLRWVSRDERNNSIRKDLMKGWDANKKKKFELLPGERWKVIKSLENIRKARTYAASNMGRIAVFRKTLSDGQLIKPTNRIDGYAAISLSHTSNRKASKHAMVSRLVAECFLYSPGEGEKMVIHKDLKLYNNAASNLEWVTQKVSLSRHKPPVYTPRFAKNPLKEIEGEEWKLVQSLEGVGKLHYMISSLGRLASYFRNFEKDAQLLKGLKKNGGQKLHRITVKVNGKYIKRIFSFQRMVAECFLPPPEKDQLRLIHRDYNKHNNLPSNLQWVNAEGFSKHFKKSEAYSVLLKLNEEKRLRGVKLTEKNVILIKRLLANPNNKIRIKTLAKQFNVHTTTIYEIKNGKVWSHVKL